VDDLDAGTTSILACAQACVSPSFKPRANLQRRPQHSNLALAGKEGVIGMHGGLPPSAVFPFTAAHLTFTSHGIQNPAQTPSEPGSTTSCSTFTRNADGTTTASIDSPEAMATIQQYPINFDGYPPLRSWFHSLTATMQKPLRKDWHVLVANGAVHSLELVMRGLLEPGDPILVEEYTFSQVIEGLIVPIGFQPVGVPMDDEGAPPDMIVQCDCVV
jgi:DNA-binding transcriptional MocR family regulator